MTTGREPCQISQLQWYQLISMLQSWSSVLDRKGAIVRIILLLLDYYEALDLRDHSNTCLKVA